MRNNKKIPEMLVGKGFPIERAHDPEGFIKATFPYTFFTGVVLLLAGLTGALELLAAYPVADTIVNLCELAVILIYGILLMNAQRKFLVGEKQEGQK